MIGLEGGGAVAGRPAKIIIVLGDIPATGHFASMAAVRGPGLATSDDAAPIFLDLVARCLPAAREGILVVYPQWQADAARRLLRLTRAVLDTDQVASIGLELPPLACSLVADLLSCSTPYLRLGHLAGLGRRLQKEILAGARLASVARLEHIETRLMDHVASYSPGSGFLALAAPRAGVERMSGREPLAAVDFRPANPVHLLIAPQGSDYPDFGQELLSVLRPQVVKTVPAQPLGMTFWGTRKHVEFVAFSGHPQALSHFVRSTRYWLCRWCGEPTSLDVCAVCGMFQGDAGPARPSTVRPTGPAPAGAPRAPVRPPAPRVPGRSSFPPGQGLAAPAPSPASPRPPAAPRGTPPNGRPTGRREDAPPGRPGRAPGHDHPPEDRRVAGPPDTATRGDGVGKAARQSSPHP
jgi:hypothetical protein